MKTQCTIHLFFLSFIVCITFSSNAFAQKGGYYRGHPRGYAYARPYVSVNVGAYAYPAYPAYPPYVAYPRCRVPYYAPYGPVVHMGFRPFGMMVSTLPYGYFSFYIGPTPYYYFNGIYYRPYSSGYRVVAPPLGAVVNHLPPGAKAKVIDGEKCYELDGTYYKENLDSENRLTYRVVGTDGVLNTEKAEGIGTTEPEVGYKTDKLPPDSRSIVIQGEKLYTTPNGLYYKEVTEGDKTYYELVGR